MSSAWDVFIRLVGLKIAGGFLGEQCSHKTLYKLNEYLS